MVKKKQTKNKKPTPKKTPFLKQIQAPATYGATRGAKPTMPTGAMQGNRMLVKNYELVATYAGNSSGFISASHLCNAGSATAFPWLSGIALNYQKFRFLYLRYFYSSAVPTSTSGVAWIDLEYDVQDVVPNTIAALSQTDTSTMGNVWFGGAVNTAKAFDKSLNADVNIYIDMDTSKMVNDWYWVRTASALQPSTGGSLTGTPTGGIGTLALVPGTYYEDAALPVRVSYGTNGVTVANPGYLYAAYICEFIDPIATALNT